MSTRMRRASASSSRRLARAGRPSSGRYGRGPAPAEDGQEVETQTGRERRVRAQGSNFKFYVALGLVVMVLAAALSYRPVMRSIYLNRLDQAQGAAAKAVADDFLHFVGNDAEHVRYAVTTNRGPVDAQIYMAVACNSFPSLVTIASRTNPDPSNPDLAAALTAAIKIYDSERDQQRPLPNRLGEWARKSPDRDVAVASIQLITKSAGNLGAGKPEEILRDVAVVPDQDPLRLTAALDGLAAVTNSSNLGYAMKVLASNAADQVMGHEALQQRIIDCATPSHLPMLIELLKHPLPGVRAVALKAMGGPGMHLNPTPDNDKTRQDLGEKLAAKLAPDVEPVEIAVTLHAVKGMQLFGARDAVLKLVPLAPGLNLEKSISNNFLAETLGKALIFDNKNELAHAATEDLVAKMVVALDDPASRSVVADALGMIRDRTLKALRPGLEKLAALGEDPSCFNALTSLVTTAFNRGDIVKANGKDLDRWKEFLIKDRPRYDRYREIADWYVLNQQFQRVSDGRKRLGENKSFITDASEQLDAWLLDPKFVPPLGLTAEDIKCMARDIKELGVSVRKAFSGALE